MDKKRRRNKEDDIRRMIGRRFFNDVLLNLINGILKKAFGVVNQKQVLLKKKLLII